MDESDCVCVYFGKLGQVEVIRELGRLKALGYENEMDMSYMGFACRQNALLI